MATPNYDVNYEDERFTQVEGDKQQALTDIEQTYGGMIGQTDEFYQDQINASKEWADQQAQIQQEQTDFTIEQIEQQKDQAHKDYLKEQSGAYQDWRKQSNQYGTEAEKMASAGLDRTGFSESSQVSMYNAYQNRVATARDVINRAMLNYDNGIKDARLQNNAALAEIHFKALQEQLQLSLEGFQYKNQLLLEQANKKLEVDNMYYSRWQDVLNQINHENAMAEDIRQFEQNYQLQTQQLELQAKELDESIRQFEKNYDLKIKEFNEGIRQFNEEIARLKAKDEQEHQMEIKKLELQQQQLAEEKRQFEESQKLKREQLVEEQRQFNEQLALQKKNSGGSGGGSGGSSGGGAGEVIKTGTTIAATGSFADSIKPKEVPINMTSVMALGFGKLTAQRLASLEANGLIQSYVKNGQRYYKKTALTSKLTGIYGKAELL